MLGMRSLSCVRGELRVKLGKRPAADFSAVGNSVQILDEEIYDGTIVAFALFAGS